MFVLFQLKCAILKELNLTGNDAVLIFHDLVLKEWDTLQQANVKRKDTLYFFFQNQLNSCSIVQGKISENNLADMLNRNIANY